MSHKVCPKIFRLGINEDWNSRWFSSKKYPKNLKEDLDIREFVEGNFERGVIEKIEINRIGNKIIIKIRTSRPGFLIGRGGEGVELISKKIATIAKGQEVKIDIEEVKEFGSSASIVSQQIANDLKRRVPYKRVVRRTLDRLSQRREIKGLKIKIKGRLDGSEIARKETFKQGSLPLHTLRAKIDYAQERAYTNYGVVGIKVWFYKGEKI